MRQDTRLSSAVPHSTAFLPPAFMAMLPPMQRGLGRGRVDREDEAGALGGVGHALRHHAGLGPDGGHRLGMAGQRDELDLGHGLELLGVDDRALPGQRDGAAGVAGAAAARDDGQAQLDAALHQAGHLGLGVGREHDERVLDAPVGGVGHVRDARQAVELDVVLGGVAAAARAASGGAGRRSRGSCASKALDGRARGCQQLAHQRVALARRRRGVRRFSTSPSRWCRASTSSARRLRVVQQVVLQVGIALHDPDVAQHLVQHAGRAAGAALARAAGSAPPRRARPAAGSRSRGRRTRCSCTGSRAGAARRRRPRPARCAMVSAGCVHRAAGMSAERMSARLKNDVTAVQHRPRRRRVMGNPACRAGRAIRDRIGLSQTTVDTTRPFAHVPSTELS